MNCLEFERLLDAGRPDALPAVSLMADLLAVLVRSLATPHTPCATTTQATDIAAVQSGDSADSLPL